MKRNRDQTHQKSPHDPVLFEAIPIGYKKNVAYIAGDRASGEVVIIDAGFKPERILDRVDALRATVRFILATHSHRDHMGAARALCDATGAPFAAYKTVGGTDVPLDDGDVLNVGNISVEVIHTPGHTADSVCFLIDGRKLMTGDTLYVGRASKEPRLQLGQPSIVERPIQPLGHRLLLPLQESSPSQVG